MSEAHATRFSRLENAIFAHRGGDRGMIAASAPAATLHQALE